MAIGDEEEDPVEAARKRSGSFTLPAITDFSLPYWKRSRNRNTGNPIQDRMQSGTLPMLNQENYRSATLNNIPVGGFGLGALSNSGYNRAGNPADIFGGQQSDTYNPQQSRSPFVSGGYQFPAGSTIPQGFMENGGGGLTQGTASSPRTSTQPFVNGGYTFPAGSTLPEGFQENGGGGLTRQVPQDQGQNQTVHFLPPGFTATTGSTGVPGSGQNDVHFLPPGFSSVQGVTNPQTKQLQAPQGQQTQFSGLPSILEMIQRMQENSGY